MSNTWKHRCRNGLIALVLMPGLAGAGPDFTGNWLRDNGTVRMAVTRCGSNFCAVNTWVKRPNGNEKVGDKIILTVTPLGPNELQGQAYDVRRQKTYRITLSLNGNRLETSGCVLLGIVCKSVGWKRVT